MFAGQCKFRRIVIERRRLPCSRRVALRAGLRISSGLMVWIQSPGVICPVTIDAVHREPSILIVDMAIGAEHRAVCPCQLKTRGVVVKGRWFPDARCVTGLAEMAEIRRHVVRVRRSLKIRLMALIAVGVNQLVIIVDMT